MCLDSGISIFTEVVQTKTTEVKMMKRKHKMNFNKGSQKENRRKRAEELAREFDHHVANIRNRKTNDKS
jgi:hypothetical protein